MKTNNISKKEYKTINEFLNLVDLKLKDVNNYNTSKINILDHNNNNVGSIYKNENEIKISTKFDNYTLLGKYNKKNEMNFIDFYLNNDSINIYGRQQITNKENEKEYNTTLVTRTNNNENITIKASKENNSLNIKIKNKNKKEEIEIRKNDGVIYHSIIEGKYDIGKESFPYKFYSVVYNQKDESKINIFLREEEGKYTVNYINKTEPKLFLNNSNKDFIHKASLMKELDYNIVERINEIKKYYKINNINLFDKIIDSNLEYPTEMKNILFETNNINLKENNTKKLQKK